MSFQVIVLGSFVAVIIVQMVHRTAGAIATILWALGLLAYGTWTIQNGAQLAFLGVPVKLWHFLAFMAVMLVYNGWVAWRLLKSRPS
jgi:hypothetical protein